MERMILSPVINVYFLVIIATTIKLIFGSLEFSPLVIGWLFFTLLSSLLSLRYGQRNALPISPPKSLTRWWIVAIAASVICVLLAPSRAVDEEHWFNDKYVDANMFRNSFNDAQPQPNKNDSLVSLIGYDGNGIGDRLLSGSTTRFDFHNRGDLPLSFPFRIILHSESSDPIDISLRQSGKELSTFRLQEKYDILKHSYGYPPANLLIDQALLVPPGESYIELILTSPSILSGHLPNVTVYDFSGMNDTETRRKFSKHFVYGDIADAREFVNLARDFKSHVFMYQRFYNDEVGAPGAVTPPEEMLGGHYWNNFPLHPFILSIAAVLIEDSMRTFTAISLLEAVLLFLLIATVIHTMGLQTGSRTLIAFALLIFAYFCFVRPGIESNSRQAIQDIFFVMCSYYLLTYKGFRFFSSAVLFMLTNFSGFGLLVFMLAIRLVIKARRKFNAYCLASVFGFQLLLNFSLTWLFIQSDSSEYWFDMQSEWWNRYLWILEWIRSVDSIHFLIQPMGVFRVLVWTAFASFLLLVGQLVHRSKASVFYGATFIFYFIIIALMEKSRGHYISTLIVMAALGGLPTFENALSLSRAKQIAWSVIALFGVAMCYFHSRLYIYTEDYLLPLFPPASVCEKIFYLF